MNMCFYAQFKWKWNFLQPSEICDTLFLYSEFYDFWQTKIKIAWPKLRVVNTLHNNGLHTERFVLIWSPWHKDIIYIILTWCIFIPIVLFQFSINYFIIIVGHVYYTYGQSSRSSDLTLDTRTPRFLWLPEHSIHIKIPRFKLAQSGSVRMKKKTYPLVDLYYPLRIIEIKVLINTTLHRG